MNVQIYFPADLINKLKSYHKKKLPTFLIGYHLENIYVVIQLATKQYELKNLPSNLNGLKIIGSVDNLILADGVNFKYDPINKLPTLKNDSGNHFIIMFEPPKYRNLEYFSITPIYLQSMGKKLVSSGEYDLYRKIESMKIPSKKITSLSEDIVLDKINQTYRIRVDLKRFLFKPSRNSNDTLIRTTKILKQLVFVILSCIIKQIQYLSIYSIQLLNLKIHQKSLVDISLTARQFDLRLKQINYFPIQYLCYYDTSRLYNQESVLLKNLNLPVFNSNLNINNSNYINFYNSIWLIFNDILVGVTLYKIIFMNRILIFHIIHKTFIQKWLFDDLHSLISWVSFDHPAGFKLNSELGQFMGDLYLWSLGFWRFLINDAYAEIHPSIKHCAVVTFFGYLKFICYFGGVSFLIGSIIDVLQVCLIHIKCFYLISMKIYNNQVKILMSLFQLFRGKKYNVLRNRIDNLNIYSARDSFDNVQFLMGTLIFMVLIFLLPTVFAFYFMFFSLKLISLLSLIVLRAIQLLFNFTPLFVILLKLKNSNRLQGGIGFDFIKQIDHTSFIKLSNKALGYHEILNNFLKLFKNLVNFNSPIYNSFLLGEPIRVVGDFTLKFNYLMLPKNFDETVKIWDHFQVDSI